MLNSRPLVLALLIAGAVSAAPAALGASAKPTLSVTPHSVPSTQPVSVKATHLKPMTTYVLLYEPTNKRKLKSLMAAATSDAHGAYAKRVKLPAMGYCGPATIYLLGRKSVVAHANITVKCSTKSPAAPPPPPKPKH